VKDSKFKKKILDVMLGEDGYNNRCRWCIRNLIIKRTLEMAQDENNAQTKASELTQLLACPFCDNNKLSISREQSGQGSTDPVIKCNCGCSLLGTWKTDEELIKLWNTRPG